MDLVEKYMESEEDSTDPLLRFITCDSEVNGFWVHEKKGKRCMVTSHLCFTPHLSEHS